MYIGRLRQNFSILKQFVTKLNMNFSPHSRSNRNTIKVDDNTTIIQIKYEQLVGDAPSAKWKEVIDTYTIKNNGDGTADITCQSWAGDVSRTLIDVNAGKEIVDVSNGQVAQKDENGKLQLSWLGEYVKNLKDSGKEATKIIKKTINRYIIILK